MRGVGKGIKKRKQRDSIMALRAQHTDYGGLAKRKMCFEMHCNWKSKDEAEKSDQR